MTDQTSLNPDLFSFTEGQLDRLRRQVMSNQEADKAAEVVVDLQGSLREVYDYMCEVEGHLSGHIAVRSYLSLPRTAEERKAIGERARRLLGIEET